MKYTGGKALYDPIKEEWVNNPRKYYNFYCSLTEWLNLNRGKSNFMYQLRDKIARDGNIKTHSYYCDENGKYLGPKLSLDRTGRRDGTETEEYSASIIKAVIKEMTNRDANVDFHSWKGNVWHVEIEFPGAEMPNIIVLLDKGDSCTSTNGILIACMDAIYKTLRNKTYFSYESRLKKYYNSDWDIIDTNYLRGDISGSCYYSMKDICGWDSQFKQKKNRKYDYAGVLSYK